MKIEMKRFGMLFEPGKEKRKRRNALLRVIYQHFMFFSNLSV